MAFDDIKSTVNDYYTDKLNRFGPSFQGVDWNSRESQELRFEQLLKICDISSPFVLNDLGCGYGAMYEYMLGKGFQFEYRGYDLSEAMTQKAELLFGDQKNCRFFNGDALQTADYTVASGLFNVKLDISEKNWQSYVFNVLESMNQSSNKGFSFNMLTQYSDKEHMKDTLYYPDPCFYFDYCKKNFSPHIALLHDYPLYEFSILVKKDS
jgi:SAM-dependent methyltransferase